MADTRPGFGIINRNVVLGRSRGRPLTIDDLYRLVLDVCDQADRIERKLDEQEKHRRASQDASANQ